MRGDEGEGFDPGAAVPEDPLDEAFRDLERDVQRRECTHDSPCDVTSIGDSQPRIICAACGTWLSDDDPEEAAPEETETDMAPEDATQPSRGPDPGTPGWVGRMDQLRAANHDMGRSDASFYRGLIDGGVPAEVADRALQTRIGANAISNSLGVTLDKLLPLLGGLGGKGEG